MTALGPILQVLTATGMKSVSHRRVDIFLRSFYAMDKDRNDAVDFDEFFTGLA
jgi:hypothetical protein